MSLSVLAPLGRVGSRPGNAIAPDTTGMNFYLADQSLRDLLDVYLPADLGAHLVPHLERFGGLAANELDALARQADRHPPVLHPRDRFGRDIPSIEFHPAYHELERYAFGELGLHAMSHRAGVLGWNRPYPMVAKHAFTFLFNQAEFGLGCPINVTDSAAYLIRRFGSAELRKRLLDRMLTQDMDRHWQGAQFMTEKEGGSDVGAATATARLVDGCWQLWGEKWFCSNANADVMTLLARPEGAASGSAGLGLFVMPRLLDDGTPNRYRIVRLKDKLGTRSMASGEIVLEGAAAWPLGDLDRGFAQMMEMVNHSRLSNGVKSAALMRRAVHDAGTVLHARRVFGRPLDQMPLARRQMLKLLLPSEQALSMWLFTADALDGAEGGPGRRRVDPAIADVLRLATPVLKFRATRDARKVTADAMEMRGGCGYVEDFVNPRLVRDAHLGSIWEGTSNIVALDAIQRAVGRKGCAGAFAGHLHGRLDEAITVPVPLRDECHRLLDRAIAVAERAAGEPDRESQIREATSVLYHAASAALMTWEGGRIHAMRGDARRLLLARLVIEHQLSARDPLQPADPARSEAITAALLDPRPVAMRTALDLQG